MYKLYSPRNRPKCNTVLCILGNEIWSLDSAITALGKIYDGRNA